MTKHDAFVLANSPFNDFLYGEVGLEDNGSELTVLSLLARLGDDPWSVVRRWAALPRATIVDLLVSDMARMPLTVQAQTDARATANRLTLLLPKTDAQARATDPLVSRVAPWLPMAAFYCAIAIGMAVNGAMMTSHKTDAAPGAPTQDIAIPSSQPVGAPRPEPGRAASDAKL